MKKNMTGTNLRTQGSVEFLCAICNFASMVAPLRFGVSIAGSATWQQRAHLLQPVPIVSAGRTHQLLYMLANFTEHNVLHAHITEGTMVCIAGVCDLTEAHTQLAISSNCQCWT